MYKKITHTIVEEHFDHPIAVDIANEANSSDESMPTKFKFFKPRIGAVSSDKFRTDINAYFSGLKSNLANMISATAKGTKDEIFATETAFFNNSEQLGDMLKPYYGIEFGERLNQNINLIGLHLIGLTREATNNLDYSASEGRLTQTENNIVDLLARYNQLWPRADVYPLIVDIINELVLFAEHTVKKNTVKAQESGNKISALLSVLSNTVANGTIQRYASSFT